jgi:outer membrane protein assembly factor BamB
MKNIPVKSIIRTVFTGAVAFTATTLQANWPQWRGPEATGVSRDAKPPIHWSESSNILWKVKVPGSGTGTPIIWNDSIFLLTAIPTGKKAPSATDGKTTQLPDIRQNAGVVGQPAPGGQGGGRGRPGGGGGRGGMSEGPSEVQQFVLLNLDRKTGKTKWQVVAREELPHEGHHRDHGYASSSAVTDGKLVYAYFGSRGLYCYDMDGKLKWQKDFGDMRTRNAFGEGSSPALDPEALVITWDHEGEDFVVALNPATGQELWRQKRDEPTSWATPLIVTVNGKKQAIISASNKIRSYDLKSGEVVWESGGMTLNVIPSPVTDGKVAYLMSGFRGNSLLAIKLGEKGNLTGSPSILWKHDKGTPYVPSPLLYDGLLYFFGGNEAKLSVVETASGKVQVDQERLEGMFGVYASPVGAENRVYVVGRDGNSMVLERGNSVKVLATNKLDEKFDASPALSGSEIYLRGHQYLYAITSKPGK